VQIPFCLAKDTMAVEHSISIWLEELKNGNPDAVLPLWQRYFERLVALAHRHLQARYKRVANEEDVALSAFDTFCRRAREGRFPDLSGRDSLWKLLFDITVK
jgi:hypothetical protein